MSNNIIWLVKVLWLCFVVYFLVRDLILEYITIKVFLSTAALKERVEKIPQKIALRVINVVLAIAILMH